MREATVGRRCPERSRGGLSAGTIQVPAGRGEAPPRDGGCALRGLGNPGWPRRVDDWAPVTNRLGTPQFGGQWRRGVSVSPPRRLHRHLGSGRCAGGGTPTRLAARQDGTADLKRGAIWSSEWGRGRGRGRPSWAPQRWPATTRESEPCRRLDTRSIGPGHPKTPIDSTMSAAPVHQRRNPGRQGTLLAWRWPYRGLVVLELEVRAALSGGTSETGCIPGTLRTDPCAGRGCLHCSPGRPEPQHWLPASCPGPRRGP